MRVRAAGAHRPGFPSPSQPSPARGEGGKRRCGTLSAEQYWKCVQVGGLMSSGPNVLDLLRRAAYYVDKILKGTRPGDLPVEQPMKFELVINLKTAQELGLTIPTMLIFQANEVIQ